MKNSTENDLKKYYFKLTAVFLINVLILFLSSGNPKWMWGWIYLLIFPVYTLINSFILPKELLMERGRSKDNMKKWDRILTGLGALPALGIIVTAGLDHRFGWTDPTGSGAHIAGLAVYIIGNIIVTWSMVSNRFFSTMVRIQADRGHEVATGGPYGVVRHPGYLGIILNTLSAPLILGSLWAMIPALILVILYIIRTVFEDKTLHEELEGYPEYATTVKKKLLPFIW